MGRLFGQHPFTGFGPSSIEPAAPPAPLHRIDGQRTGQLRARVRQECPRSPGVYGMVDGHGELIYVGKAKNLRARLLSYFRPKSRVPKAGRIIQATRTLCWETGPNEFAALLRELELIRRWRPVGNVKGQPRRYARTFLCLGRRPAPYVFLTRRPPSGVLACWGPVIAGRRSREAVRRVNDCFGLRDCPQAQEMIFADPVELFPIVRAPGCLRFEIGTCLGPCAALCSRSAYGERVRAARAFLDGSDVTLLQTLQHDMQTAATALAFERAANLREKWTSLTWLHEHLEGVRRAREQFHFIYPVTGRNGQDFWYLIRHAAVTAAIPVPCDDAGRQQAATLIETIFGTNTGGPPNRADEIDSVLLVAAWFHRYPKQRERTLTPAQALACCRSEVTLTDPSAE